MSPAKRLTSENVLERLSDLFVRGGVPEHIRSNNGSEFTAECVREWLARVGVKTLSIEPGSPCENGYVESFNGKLRDKLLAREAFDTLLEAKVLIDRGGEGITRASWHQPPAAPAGLRWGRSANRSHACEPARGRSCRGRERCRV